MNQELNKEIRNKETVCKEISRLYGELRDLYAKEANVVSILQQKPEEEKELVKIRREEEETRIAIVNLEQILELMEQSNSVCSTRLHNRLNVKTQEALVTIGIKIILKPIGLVAWK